METLTDWGKGCHSGLLPLSKNDLGLSPQYFYQVLESAAKIMFFSSGLLEKNMFRLL
jgi:hypothetical protein